MDGLATRAATTSAARSGWRLRARSRQHPADEFLELAVSSHPRLMRVHRRHLASREDLEDCFWQGAGELWASVREGKRFESSEHAAHALEQRFASRIRDLRRDRGTRERWLPGVTDSDSELLDELADGDAIAEDRLAHAFTRDLLLDVLHDLSLEERRLLVCQANGLSRAEICDQFDWHVERYKSLVRRSWGKLRVLIPEAESGGRCGKLETSVLAYAGGALDGFEEARIQAHLRACPQCSQQVASLRRAARNLRAFLPAPMLAAGVVSSGLAKVAAVAAAGRDRLVGIFTRAPQSDPGASSAAGGALAGGGVVKAVAAVCVTGIGATGVCVSPLVGSSISGAGRSHQTAVRQPASARKSAPAHRATPQESLRVLRGTAGVTSTSVATIQKAPHRTIVRARPKPRKTEFSFEGGGTAPSPKSTVVHATVARAATSTSSPIVSSAPSRRTTPAPPSGQKEFGP